MVGFRHCSRLFFCKFFFLFHLYRTFIRLFFLTVEDIFRCYSRCRRRCHGGFRCYGNPGNFLCIGFFCFSRRYCRFRCFLSAGCYLCVSFFCLLTCLCFRLIFFCSFFFCSFFLCPGRRYCRFRLFLCTRCCLCVRLLCLLIRLCFRLVFFCHVFFRFSRRYCRFRRFLCTRCCLCVRLFCLLIRLCFHPLSIASGIILRFLFGPLLFILLGFIVQSVDNNRHCTVNGVRNAVPA